MPDRRIAAGVPQTYAEDDSGEARGSSPKKTVPRCARVSYSGYYMRASQSLGGGFDSYRSGERSAERPIFVIKQRKYRWAATENERKESRSRSPDNGKEPRGL